jgi:hypothetical protein
MLGSNPDREIKYFCGKLPTCPSHPSEWILTWSYHWRFGDLPTCKKTVKGRSLVLSCNSHTLRKVIIFTTDMNDLTYIQLPISSESVFSWAWTFNIFLLLFVLQEESFLSRTLCVILSTQCQHLKPKGWILSVYQDLHFARIVLTCGEYRYLLCT